MVLNKKIRRSYLQMPPRYLVQSTVIEDLKPNNKLPHLANKYRLLIHPKPYIEPIILNRLTFFTFVYLDAF